MSDQKCNSTIPAKSTSKSQLFEKLQFNEWLHLVPITQLCHQSKGIFQYSLNKNNLNHFSFFSFSFFLSKKSMLVPNSIFPFTYFHLNKLKQNLLTFFFLFQNRFLPFPATFYRPHNFFWYALKQSFICANTRWFLDKWVLTFHNWRPKSLLPSFTVTVCLLLHFPQGQI